MFPIELHHRRQRRSAARSDILLIVRSVAQRQIVTNACAAALDLGVHPGMALSDARAILPRRSIVIEPHDPHRFERALSAVAMWTHRFSPVVALDEPDALLLDITGCAHLFGGEEGMLQRVTTDFARLGFSVRAATAPTYASAAGVARFADTPLVVQQDQIRHAIDPLPLEALRLEANAIAGMAEVGIKRVGELLTMPRAAISVRFGDDVLRRIDQALGRAPEVILPIRPIDPPFAEQVFLGPCCCLETIGLSCRDLLDRVCVELARRSLGLMDCRITLNRSDIDPLHIDLRLSAACRDEVHLWSLLRPRLERSNLGFGVEGVSIKATRLGHIREEQQHWWREAQSTTRPNAALDQLLDTLVNRLGKDNVLRPQLLESHIPERAFRLASVLDAHRPAAPTPIVDADRPAILLDEPQQIDVLALTPDGPVSRITWRSADSAITTCIGPERICSEWWRSERFIRDYFKVQNDQGRWLWIYRDLEQSAWFVHGTWS